MKRLWALAWLVACGGAKTPATPTAPTPPAAPVPMKGPTPTAFDAQLTAIGLDPANLPPLGKLAPEQLRKVMPLFAKSLGTKCEGCHGASFDQRTPEMNVAEQMWNHFSQELTLRDGGPLFCDSCHHGRAKVLDRRDTEKLAVWMDENYATKLARKAIGAQAIRAEHACPTCHGEPAEMRFIRFWAAGKPFPNRNAPSTPQLSR